MTTAAPSPRSGLVFTDPIAWRVNVESCDGDWESSANRALLLYLFDGVAARVYESRAKEASGRCDEPLAGLACSWDYCRDGLLPLP